jgi:hypothetical protein
MGTSIFLTCCWSILIIIHVLNSQYLVAAMLTTVLLCLFLSAPEAFMCHWYWMEPKWLEKHHIYGYQYFSHLLLIYIDHNPCLKFYKFVVAAMPTSLLLFHLPFWTRGLHWQLVMHGEKMTREAPDDRSQHFSLLLFVCLYHNPCVEFTNMRLLQCPPLFGCSLSWVAP